MEVVLLALGLVGIAVLLLGFNIFFRKKEFPDSHLSHNKEMVKRGIVCAKAMDRIERKKLKASLKFEGLQITQK
ncbi:MAG: hypothetical protein PF517_21045 [Salinivirgaceae bacterium]|jgi:hypothetical protein|nr:hypothetical protein [Salinivirgaceae bacterium]